MTESLPANDPGTQKRRSTRIVQAVPITVTGVDALGQPFKERSTTVMVNCHGCKYQSKHYVPKNTIVTLDIPRPETNLPARSVQGRVVWVQRPRTVRELFQIGLEFEVAGNVWGIAFPPQDWLTSSDELAAPSGGPADADGASAKPGARTAPTTPSSPSATKPATPAATVAARPAAPAAAVPPSAPRPPAPPTATHGQTGSSPTAPSATQLPTRPVQAPPPSADAKVRVMPSPPAAAAPPALPSQPAQMTVAREMARMVADAKEELDRTLKKGADSAISERMNAAREELNAQLNTQLHQAMEKAIQTSVERVSESAAQRAVQQAAERTAAMVEDARRASNESAGLLDAKVRQAVQDAVKRAADEAAQQAAQQTATLHLKQSVEEAVERALRDREAATP